VNSGRRVKDLLTVAYPVFVSTPSAADPKSLALLPGLHPPSAYTPPVEPGRALSQYRLAAKIGVGGMGEVWQASDTTLGRDVAIKVLPAALASDPERLARFEREAKVLASLNHPNIASIYGFHDDGGVRFLAMELVPGEDLAERLKRGRLQTEDAVDVARQVAEALEAAHEQGIVHRDLKPANIRITPAGKVKVLDFGLAKALDPMMSGSGVQGDPGASPTITSLGTVAGVILGTAAYMSPEQARGKTTDRRADIWAFGVIVFEMLTGKRLFDGETISDTLASVLKNQPDWSELPASTPPALISLLKRCLERDPRQRLRDIGEARVALSGDLGSSPDAAVSAASRPAGRSELPWLLFGIAAITAVILGFQALAPSRSAPARVRKFTVDAQLVRGGNLRAFQISPDGTRIVFQSERGIEVRELRETESRLLVKDSELGTGENGATPFWSTDGSSIAYSALGSLMRIPAAGGAPTTICKLPGDWNGGAWMPDDTIAFSTTRGPMFRVPARGGDPSVLIPIVPKQELDFHDPSLLPDGRSLIYPVHRASGVDTIEMFRDGKRTVVLRLDSSHINVQDSPQLVNAPFYSATGHILYQRDQGNEGLWALPFSAERGTATGDPFLIAAGMGYPSVAADGTLVFAKLSAVNSGQLLLVTRDGKVEGTLGETRPQTEVGRFSPDGKRLLYLAAERQDRDVYVWDFEGGKSTRLTNTAESEGEPVWIPGSARIAFSAPSGTCRSIFAMNADGTGTRELLAERGSEPSFTPDGREVVYSTACQERRGLDRLVIGRPGVVPLMDAPAGIDSPFISPDGRFLAYRSWAGGKPERFVTRYPSMDGRWLVASSSGSARWSADGKEIYYVEGPPYRMMASPVRLDPAFSTGTPKALFDLASVDAAPTEAFDVSPDGKRFAMIRSSGASDKQRMIVVVENWFEEFRTPPGR
jgi:serine/threonine protein kinase/Tol biopolymer transport system component